MIKSLLKLATVISVVGSIVVAPVANIRAEALTEAQALERLNSIPVFTISDDKGEPILGTRKNGETQQAIIIFFLNPDDAKSMLTQIKSSNPDLAAKAKVIAGTLNGAFQIIKNNPDKKVAFTILPSKASIDSARTILSSQGKQVDKLPNFLPVFFATGGKDKDQGLLTVEQNGKQLIPFFLDQKDLQGFINQAKQQQPNTTNDTKIQVTSLFNVIDSMVSKDNKPNPEADKFMFVPSRAALEVALKQQPKSPQSNQPQLKPSAQNPANLKPAAKPSAKPAAKPSAKPAPKN